LDMPVRFTVDAHPDRTFRGKVTQIRLNAQMTQTVVTYTVIVTANNPDGKLLPYLTANVQFEVDHRPDVLMVANEALRWTPSSDQIDPTVDKASISQESADGQKRGCLWVVAGGGRVRPVEITLGISDGIRTEISGDNVKEGMQAVTGEEEGDAKPGVAETASKGDKTSNPFLPKLPKNSRPPPGPM
jgi:HlyD family secretion protein